MSALFPRFSGSHARLSRIAWWLEQSAFGLLLMLVACLPWIFSRTQLDVVELPKQTVLIASAGLVWFLLVLHDAAQGSWRIAWDRSAKILALAMVALGITAFFSRDSYGSWVGMTKQIPVAVLTMVAGFAWWLAIRRLVQTPLQLMLVLGTWMTSGGLFAWGTLAWLFGVSVWPWSLSVFRAITPLGAVSEVALFLVPIALLATALLVQGEVFFRLRSHKQRAIVRAGAAFVLFPCFMLFGAVGSGMLWGVLFMGMIAFLMSAPAKRERLWWLFASVVCLGSLISSVMPARLNVWRLFFDRWSLTIPAEVTLGTRVSWSMALQGLREHVLVGSGAGTWVNLFLAHRDPALNQSPYATVRFFQAASSAATAVGTVGLLGTVSLLTWLLLPGITVLQRQAKNEESELAPWRTVLLPLWLISVVLWFGSAFSLVHVVFVWLMSALLLTTKTGKVPARAFHFDHPIKGILPLTLATLVAFICSWVGMQRFVAERLFIEGKNALEERAYGQAERRLALAHAWNPWTDVYTSLLSQLYAQEARTELARRPSPSMLPRISELLRRSEQLNAEARLQHPDRIELWLAAAAIVSTRNSLVAPTLWSNGDIAALLHAQALDPSNPQQALLLANTYMQRAEQESTWLLSPDEQTKTAARLRLEEATREATKWYDRAEALQPHLPATAAGRARLALLNGKKEEAIQALEALRASGNQSQELQIQIALLYEQVGQSELATRLLEAVIKDHPADAVPLARWSLARLYASVDRVEEAITLLEALAKQFPHESIVQQQLAELQRIRLEETKRVIAPASPTTTTSTVPTKSRPRVRRRS